MADITQHYDYEVLRLRGVLEEAGAGAEAIGVQGAVVEEGVDRTQGFEDTFFGPRVLPLSERVFRGFLATSMDWQAVEVTVGVTDEFPSEIVEEVPCEVVDFLDFLD